MIRLIDAGGLVIKLSKKRNNGARDSGLICYDAVLAAIADAPTVDAVVVAHGRWFTKILVGGFAEEWGHVCSVCGCIVSDRSGLGKYQGKNQQLNFCPNCGADMRDKEATP